ncbi:MAG: uracil-DNA glycosylase [Planctomycetota bacterium]
MPDPDAQRQLAQRLRAEALFGVEIVPLPGLVEPMDDSPPAAPPRSTRSVVPASRAAVPPPTPPIPAVPPGRSAPAAAPPSPGGALFGKGFGPDEFAGQTLTAEHKQRLLDELKAEHNRDCPYCNNCPSATQTVFGEGAPDARLMFVGEGPGQTEDQTGRPFVGRAGELLNKQIEAMGIRREDVYIANVVKARPPNNRTPTPEEVANCGPYLVRQVRIIRPEAIVTLGGPASKLLLDTVEGITRLRGRWGVFSATDPPTPVMPTFHPAFLLRAYTRDNRMKVWADLQAVMAKLGMKGTD